MRFFHSILVLFLATIVSTPIFSKDINILLIGSTGVGKSTFLNAVHNIISDKSIGNFEYKVRQEAGKLIGSPRGGIRKRTNDEASFSSVTSQLEHRQIITHEHTLNIFDIPGFGDTRKESGQEDADAHKAILDALSAQDIHVIAHVLSFRGGSGKDSSLVTTSRHRFNEVFGSFIEAQQLEERIIVIGTHYDSEDDIEERYENAELELERLAENQSLPYQDKRIFPFGFKNSLELTPDRYRRFKEDRWSMNQKVLNEMIDFLATDVKFKDPISGEKLKSLRESFQGAKNLLTHVITECLTAENTKDFLDKKFSSYKTNQEKIKTRIYHVAGRDKKVCNNKDLVYYGSAWNPEDDTIKDINTLRQEGENHWRERVALAQRNDITIEKTQNHIENFLNKIENLRLMASSYDRYLVARVALYSAQTEFEGLNGQIHTLKDELSEQESLMRVLEIQKNVEDERFDAMCHEKVAREIYGYEWDSSYDSTIKYGNPYAHPEYYQKKFHLESKLAHRKNTAYADAYYDASCEKSRVQRQIERHSSLKNNIPVLQRNLDNAIAHLKNHSICEDLILGCTSEVKDIQKQLEEMFPNHFENYFQGKDLWFFQKWFCYKRDNLKYYPYEKDLKELYKDQLVCSCGKEFQDHHHEIEGNIKDLQIRSQNNRFQALSGYFDAQIKLKLQEFVQDYIQQLKDNFSEEEVFRGLKKKLKAHYQSQLHTAASKKMRQEDKHFHNAFRSFLEQTIDLLEIQNDIDPS